MDRYDIEVHLESVDEFFFLLRSWLEEEEIEDKKLEDGFWERMVIKASQAFRSSCEVTRCISKNCDVLIYKKFCFHINDGFHLKIALDRILDLNDDYTIEIEEHLYNKYIPSIYEIEVSVQNKGNGYFEINPLYICIMLMVEIFRNFKMASTILGGCIAEDMEHENVKMQINKSLDIDEDYGSKKKGRPKKTFRDYMIGEDNIDLKLKRLRDLIRGKKGKTVALVIIVAISENWIERPTYQAVSDEFGDIGNRSGYNHYMNRQLFTDEEIEGMRVGMRL